MDDFGAPAGQAVDDPVDGVLVSGDERGSQDDRVPGFDVDLVVPVGHAAQGGHGLALGAGAHQDDFVGGQRLEVARVHEQVAGDFEVAELPGDVHVADHGAAHEGDFAAVGLGRVEDLLDPVDVGRKTGDDDALLGFREDRVEDAGDVAFAGDEAGDFRVGGVRHQQVDAFRAEPREPAEVGDAVVQRQLVHFEVAGVQHVAGRGAHTDRERIRDGVVDREELEVEGAEGVLFAFGDLDQGRFDAVFPEFGGEQGQGEAGAYQRDIGAFPQQEGDAANVVFVAVREHDRLDVVEAPPQVFEVGEDQVDSGLLFRGKEHTAVDDEHFPLVFEDGHVAADLTQPAQGDDPQGVAGQWRRGPELGVRVAHAVPSVSRSASLPLAASS